MDAPRLVRYPTTDGKEGWAKEVGDMVMPASSDEVAMWKENERLREDAVRLYTSLRRMANGMHAGDYGDAKAALDDASALLGELGDRYER